MPTDFLLLYDNAAAPEPRLDLARALGPPEEVGALMTSFTPHPNTRSSWSGRR
jgi:hypothetical protein